MTWKAIGKSVTGFSHVSVGKGCEDAICYRTLTDHNGDEVLACALSDGAGSARYAALASAYTVEKVIDFAVQLLKHKDEVTEGHIYALAEDIFYGLEQEAISNNVPLNDYSCTLLGCIITLNKAAFFQIGDGAIIRNDDSGYYNTLWWPQNGEYQNSTTFLVDDSTFANLQIAIIDQSVTEVALFTDGLQLLTLNMDSLTVHQPFFSGLFHHLRTANDSEKINILNKKLAEYLDSNAINERTDDDKTLFLASRLTI
ncbi:MAG: protein phosphatase 2C domain-containing protein [Taibaiella sp.]|nr:protein phosphatase 2C domain-containing protein [Taibaiella sp.]